MRVKQGLCRTVLNRNTKESGNSRWKRKRRSAATFVSSHSPSEGLMADGLRMQSSFYAGVVLGSTIHWGQRAPRYHLR